MTIDEKAREESNQIISALNELIRKDNKKENDALINAVSLIKRQNAYIDYYDQRLKEYEDSGVSLEVDNLINRCRDKCKRIETQNMTGRMTCSDK